jgi:hypothetical protein
MRMLTRCCAKIEADQTAAEAAELQRTPQLTALAPASLAVRTMARPKDSDQASARAALTSSGVDSPRIQ